jgi:hypothetical protein
VGALDRLVGRVRAKPRLVVAISAGVLLVAAWLASAIYVASDRGLNEGIGVLVAWPALLAALILIALPFVGIYLLVRWLAGESGADEEEATPVGGEEPAEAEEAQATESG